MSRSACGANRSNSRGSSPPFAPSFIRAMTSRTISTFCCDIVPGLSRRGMGRRASARRMLCVSLRGGCVSEGSYLCTEAQPPALGAGGLQPRVLPVHMQVGPEPRDERHETAVGVDSHQLPPRPAHDQRTLVDAHHLVVAREPFQTM